MRLGPAIRAALLDPAAAAVGAGRAVEREARRVVLARLSDAALATLDGFLDSRVAGDAVDRIVDSELPRRAAARALADGIVEEAAARMLDGPELDRVVEAMLESRLLDDAVERLLKSEELWLVVEEVARSPAVTEAITQQGMGFADQVAGGVRSRSRRADEWLERAARRTLRLERPGG